MYKLKDTNGRVKCVLRAGKDFVKTNIALSMAQAIMKTGKTIESTLPDYPICIDGEWYFEGNKVVEHPKKENKHTDETDEKAGE